MNMEPCRLLPHSPSHLLSGTTLVNIVCCSSAVGFRAAGGVGLTSGAGTMAGRSTSLGTRCEAERMSGMSGSMSHSTSRGAVACQWAHVAE